MSEAKYNDVKEFPLEQWFDTSKRIDKYDAELAEAQMALYAIKDNEDPDSAEAVKQYRKMWAAVKVHNRKFNAQR